MELKAELLKDIRILESELEISQDEKAYNDKSDYYLLNRLAELRIIKVQRKIISQGEEILKLDTRHDSEETRKQVENVKEQIRAEEEKNKEIEMQYQNFANVYFGQDNSLKGEMLKILDEYEKAGLPVSRDIVSKTDEYMFDNYAVTEEKMKKATSDDTSGGRGLGLSMERESENEMD
ncbi:MAG: hypothetical protein MJ246_04590 [Clostridia bacterium]|nr:hypothetical protein [Clostridia bacterium]